MALWLQILVHKVTKKQFTFPACFLKLFVIIMVPIPYSKIKMVFVMGVSSDLQKDVGWFQFFVYPKPFKVDMPGS